MKLLLVMLLCGCAIVRDRTPDAVQLLWYGTLKAQQPPPKITWEDGLNVNGEMLEGVYFHGFDAVVVRRTKISDSAFAHELLHAYFWLEKGEPTADHPAPFNAYVDSLNVILAHHGM